MQMNFLCFQQLLSSLRSFIDGLSCPMPSFKPQKWRKLRGLLSKSVVKHVFVDDAKTKSVLGVLKKFIISGFGLDDKANVSIDEALKVGHPVVIWHRLYFLNGFVLRARVVLARTSWRSSGDWSATSTILHLYRTNCSRCGVPRAHLHHQHAHHLIDSSTPIRARLLVDLLRHTGPRTSCCRCCGFCAA